MEGWGGGEGGGSLMEVGIGRIEMWVCLFVYRMDVYICGFDMRNLGKIVLSLL